MVRYSHAFWQVALRECEPGRRRCHSVGRVERVLRAGHAAALEALLQARVAPGARAAAGGCKYLELCVRLSTQKQTWSDKAFEEPIGYI